MPYRRLTHFALLLFVLLSSLILVNSQTTTAEKIGAGDLPGKLELVDVPPEATPVSALMVRIYSPETLSRVDATPNAEGAFVLKNVKPGHYVLELPVPGRIRSFTSGSRPLNPQGFDLAANETGPLLIALSYKTASLFVNVTGIPETRSTVALLFPDDPYLTPQSGRLMRMTNAQVAFLYTQPGKYRLFVVDSECQDDVAYHPALRRTLHDEASLIEVVEKGETRASAKYLDRSTLKQAIQAAKPTDPDSREGRIFYSTPLRCE